MVADLLFGSRTADSQALIASSEHRFRPSQECVVRPHGHPWCRRMKKDCDKYLNTRNQMEEAGQG